MGKIFWAGLTGTTAFIMLSAFGPDMASAGFMDQLKSATNQMNQYNNAQQQQQGGGYGGGGSLSAALGATNLDGLSKFANCQSESVGYREGLIADRLEAKLANTPNLTPQDRGAWLADIASLRQVRQTHARYNPPDPNDPQRYLMGLTEAEEIQINSQNNRFIQETNLKCEHLYGGMSRYSGTGHSDMQDQYEDKLRREMRPAVQDNIPITPLPPRGQKAGEEDRAAALKVRQDTAKQVFMQKFNNCQASAKGLRPRLMAQALQRKLDNSSGLSAQERGELQADVQAAWASAGKGLDRIEPADPKNPYRAEQRLNLQEQTDLNNEYVTQYTQIVQGCTGQPTV